MLAKRIDGYAHVDDSQVCYWKSTDGWVLYLPGCGLGRISKHTVEEHPDGTITVSPSIRMTTHRANGEKVERHGYLTRGAWMEVQ